MSERFDGWTLRQEYIRCGRSGCRKCPHGPYWYGYRRVGKRMEKKYFGKRKPELEAYRVPESSAEEPHRDDTILSRRTASAETALRILGLGSTWPNRLQLHKAYRVAILRSHPDRGGDLRECQRVNAAFEYLRGVVS